MNQFTYVAMNSQGRETKGILEVDTQIEAIQRLKEMGFFPTRILPRRPARSDRGQVLGSGKTKSSLERCRRPGRVKTATLTEFTGQLATLVEAGLPLLQALRVLEEQERSTAMRQVIRGLCHGIESGNTFSEALTAYPRVFSRLYVNMVRAGELGGLLEVTLKRLSEFMEKAQRIKGKIASAMVYPCAVLFVAVSILSLLLLFVVPTFKEVFQDLSGGSLPAFTLFVFGISDAFIHHFAVIAGGVAGTVILLGGWVRTRLGRRCLDRLKLNVPVLGPVFQRVSIARFTRTLGTLLSSGVPILQALTILKETSGNVLIGEAVAAVHESVKEGEAIAEPLRHSHLFPPLVVSMVHVGEQTGALPEMLLKISDKYDEEVDRAVGAMTSLLEPILIVALAIVVGCLVVALFLPIIQFSQ